MSSTWVGRQDGRDRWEMAVTTWWVEGSPRQGLRNLQKTFPMLAFKGGKGEWAYYRDGWEVLRVLIVPRARIPLVERRVRARVAIVIDDMGYRVDRARAFLDLPWSITLSILPFTDRAREIACLAHKRGREVMLHLPMDANGGGEAIERLESRTPGMLLVSMSEGELRALVRREMDQVPYARGANNHMGSRFTRDTRCMRVVLQELKARGYYFLDSLTDSRSVACREARRLGLRCFERDVFLDNSRDEAYILHQLTLLAQLALKKGYAVAIGHPSQATLVALRKGLPKLEKMGIKVVPLSEL
ncbi:MAG TPA: divergent polysaccharide deacetylase family protein [Thermosulfidibacter takaii]|uniref:Divergent polysaccharide deacetylase family protein n=1 Tax=Thermosulfidibacter takaii TaxID=412593 RepID=A0A7C0Y8F6_9BACT|nr:divergent polysaccharide deacetylase family protein [Thermosulfidibacter takaii]